MIRKNFTIEKAKDAALKNIADIIPMCKWNYDHNIFVLRLSSDIFPHFNDNEVELYDMSFAIDALRQAGEAAIKYKQRINFHPGQYNQIGAKENDVFVKTCTDLKMHAEFRSKGKKVLYAKWDGNDEKMNWVDSRKKVYVPLYPSYMEGKEMATEWKKKVQEQQKDVVIYDFDGPRQVNGDVMCKEVTLEFLRDKINDTRFPFGHGYIVAAHPLDISLDEFL